MGCSKRTEDRRIVGAQELQDERESRFAVKKDVKIDRNGRADILATANKQSHLIELKGFDPSKAQIEKELLRIQEFFALNAGCNSLVAGHIVFPSLINCQNRLEKDVLVVWECETRNQGALAAKLRSFLEQ